MWEQGARGGAGDRAGAAAVTPAQGKIGTTMVFVLDNYDSFTYNLVQYMGELGAEMVVRRNDELTPAEVEALRPPHILISPGPCTPEDAGISIELIQHFARLAREGGGGCRSWACAWGIRRLARRLAGRWCVRRS